MNRAVERRPKEVVHPGVRDDEELARALLDVEDFGHERAGGADDRAARLDEDRHRQTRHVRQDRGGVRFGGERLLPRPSEADAAADVERRELVAFRREVAREASKVARRIRERLWIEDLAADVRLDPGHPDVREAARLPENRGREIDRDAELVVLAAG